MSFLLTFGRSPTAPLDEKGMQTTQVAAVVTVIALIALALGTAAGYYIYSGQTTTVTILTTLTNSATVVALSTVVTTRNVTQTTTTLSGVAAFFQPCENEAWNGSGISHGPFIVPVLLMRPNSTAYFCVVYQSAWKGNQTLYADPTFKTDPFIVNGTYRFFPFEIDNIRCTSSNNNQTSSCDYIASNSFKVSVLPDSISLSASTDYVTVIYTVTASGNSTGFYDQSAPWNGCLRMPMAVGYSASQVNVSEFILPLLSMCIGQLFTPVYEYTTGMNVTYLDFT